MKWEYCRVKAESVLHRQKDLDGQGERGWELVQIVIDADGWETAIFKRPLPDADPEPSDDDGDLAICERIEIRQKKIEALITHHADRLSFVCLFNGVLLIVLIVILLNVALFGT